MDVLSVQPWADLQVPLRLPSLPGKRPLRCSHPLPWRCLPHHLPCEAGAWLQVACTLRSSPCPRGGGFLHCCPVPLSRATQHLYPLSGSHCPSVGPFAPHPFAASALTASDLPPSPPAAWTPCSEEGVGSGSCCL